MNKKEGKKEIHMWAVIFWLLVWQITSMIIDSNIILVSPIQGIKRLLQLALELKFWKSILYSFLRITGGFLLALIAGVFCSALSFRYKRIRQLMTPMILAIKTIPVASFIILSLVWFSSANLAVFISFLMVFPIIYTNILKGICETDPKLIEMANVFSISVWKKIRYIYIPEALPYFRAGCTIALGLCWKSGIAAEVIGMPYGSIGEQLQQAKVYLETADLFAWTLVIVLISISFEKVFLKLIDQCIKKLEEAGW